MKKIRVLTSLLITVLLSASFISCDQLQDMLSSEQEKDMAEETGIVSLGLSSDSGNVWYFDGISTTDFSNTSGAALALSFSKKAAVGADKNVSDFGVITYTSHLSGSVKVNYTSVSGQSASEAFKVSEGKIILNSVSSPAVTVSAGEMSTDGKVFRFNMAPVIKFLDAETAKDNVIDSVEIKLSGFVCAEGRQKGRSIAPFEKKFSVKPFYEDETILTGVTFSTVSSTAAKKIVIPVNGGVSLSDGASVSFYSEDASASFLSDSDFTVGVSEDGITITCSKELKDKTFDAEFTVSGFIPALNASSYTRTFKVHLTPVFVTLDGVLDEEAWESAESSSESLANPSGYNLTEVAVTNDDENLYIAVKGDFSSFVSGDNIIIMIDNRALSGSGKTSSDSSINNYLVPATNSSFTGVDFYLCHILADASMHDYVWGPRADGVLTSASSTGNGIIEYKVPLSVIGASAGNELKIFASVSSYEWVSGGSPDNTFTVKDCIPSSAAAVSNGGQTLSVAFADAMSYTIK
ncbi:MAG: hypothetical protein J6Y93_05410 [Treponema sp.]|nr:hypothetical protein [Treponema sp.]